MFRRRKTLIIRRKNSCETELSSLLCSLHMVFSFPPSWTKNFTNHTKLRHVYFTSRKTITRQEEFSSKGTDRQVCVLFQNTVSKALSFFSVPFCTSLWQMLNYQQRTRKREGKMVTIERRYRLTRTVTIRNRTLVGSDVHEGY